MPSSTYGHTPYRSAFDRMDPYAVAYDPDRAARRPLRLGIVGAGGVARAKYLPALARLRMMWEPVEFAAFAEPREREARQLQAVYGGRWYADLDSMLRDESLDAALILSPDDLHARHAIACLEAGLHVLVEKPIARSLVDARRMCQRADDLGRVLMCVATWRFAPPYRHARRLIDDGPVRDPALFTGKFNLGYDYVDLFESGTIHLFDITRFLMGDVVRVTAVGVNRYGASRRNYPVDNAAATLEFASGAIGTLTTSATALSFKPWSRVEVVGHHAWLAVEDQYELLLYDAEDQPAKSWKPVVPSTLLFDEEFGGFTGLLENFLQAVRGLETPVVTGWDGYYAYELLTAVQLAIARGEPVSLPLDPASADAEARDWLVAHGWPATPEPRHAK